MRRITSFLLAGAMALMLLAGCSGSGANPKDQTPAEPSANSTAAAEPDTMPEPGDLSNEPMTLSVWTSQYNEADLVALESTIAAFNQKYPNVTVDLVTVEDYETAYKLAFDGNDGPDVVYVDDTTQVLLERYGYLKDITAYVEQYGWADVCQDGLLDYQNARHPGRYYSASAWSNPRAFWYNKTIFDALGLSVPTTLAELEECARVVREAGYVPFELSTLTLLWNIDELIFDYAGYDEVADWYYLRGTSAGMENARLTAMETIQNWRDSGYFRDEAVSLDTTAAFTMFASGTSAMFYCSGNISNYFDAYVSGFEVGAFPFPAVEAGAEKVIVNGAHGGWAMNAAIEDEKAGMAAEFINMFFTEEVNGYWVAAGYFSALSYDAAGVNTSPSYEKVVNACEGTKIGFFMDNALTGLLDKMLSLNEAFLLGDIDGASYASSINETYDTLKAEQAG